LSQRDFVTREEFDVVRAMAVKAREENELLRASIEKLKSKPIKTTKKNVKKLEPK
jgi:BMFP domain-containing protein YqiC